MKTKIKQILLDNLRSAYDDGDIDNGGIYGGSNAIDKLYDLFVDEVTSLNELNGIILSRAPAEIKDKPTSTPDVCDHPEEWRTRYEGGSSWCRKCWCYVDLPKPKPEPKKKKTKENEIQPFSKDIWMVRYSNPICGDKGEAVYIAVYADNEEHAKDEAMEYTKFTEHIYMKYYDKKYLHAYRAKRDQIVGRVEYFEGDPRL